MSVFKKPPLLLAFLAISASPAFAQDWGVGASIGLANDVEHRVRLDRFDPRDVHAWIDFALEERVLLRGTLGSIKTTGSNAGPVTMGTGAPPSTGIMNSPGPAAALPPRTIHLPSGDHEGLPRTSMVSARGRRSPPSTETSVRIRFPCRLSTTATRSPFGETPAGPSSAPSEPFQISADFPSS